ncbi:phosphatase PAP2 family protein [Sphingomonas carotinifaciens]|uniref:Phosphatase PAP2 family protein n=1 Tax=Sphingomonas carotinifaciens TaxID=1166323 RepID=A0A1G7G8V1_9SPHN|nr:phosphatase PAP2 family protein [Sphingomonas carotinifaciens]MBB4086071.1 undecaprenyl-diphosphatase [Sphingomonas carotinifaciens]MWC42761.1 phosphatase PAP2 family protein [Sphingomonas carotinifaciens]SDE84574.1 undecaprenyl-diphosphatase [Sphingomonas carotinifaciens]
MIRRARTLPPALAGMAAAAVALALVLLVGLAVDRWSFAFDHAILVSLRAWGGPSWLPRVAKDVTALGGGVILTLVVIAVTGLLLVQRLWLTALAVLAASISGGMAVDAIKAWAGRARPDLVDHLVTVTNASFPSGHAANSATVYLTVAALSTQVLRQSAARTYTVVVAVLLVGAIGLSRIYLGVHWPTDVLAGWSFGTLWALAWWWATERARASIGGER